MEIALVAIVSMAGGFFFCRVDSFSRKSGDVERLERLAGEKCSGKVILEKFRLFVGCDHIIFAFANLTISFV